MSLEGPKKSVLKKERPKSSISDVAGASPELNRRIIKGKEETFEKQEFKSLVDKEREKTPEDLEMIAIANEATNALRRKFGLEDFNIPAKNFHIIPKDKWIRSKDSDGAYAPLLQGVLIKDSNISKLYQLSTIIHEMIHFKAYNALQIELGEQLKTKENPKGKPKITDYRGGFEIKSRDGKKTYFTELNEAITEELTKTLLRILVPELRSNPIFKDEMDETEKIVKSHSKTLFKNGRLFFDSDTVHAGIKIPPEMIGKDLNSSEMKGKLEFSKRSFTYRRQRRMLNSLIDKVWKANKEEFKSRGDVFDAFAAAYMTGNMLTMGGLIEETFGKGSFRKIGELDMETKKVGDEKK